MDIHVNGVQLYYEKIGTGEPVIFVHGNQEDHQIFFELAHAIKDQYTCYLFDSRNHGKSTITDMFDYKVMAEDYIQAIDRLTLTSPYFLGYSDGGIIGLMIALQRPQLLRKMMICGANINPLGIVKNARNQLQHDVKRTKNPYLKMMLDQPNISFNSLTNISIPTMVIAGEFDVIQRRHTIAISNHLQRSKLMIIEKKHHDDYLVHRDDLNDVISDFFSER